MNHTSSNADSAIPNGFDFEIARITPTMARSILQSSVRGTASKVYERKVDDIAKKMMDGEFRFTGLPVTISEDGEVLAGSQYLEACIKSGKSFESVVVRGVSKNCRRTIEMGSTRRLMDHLTSMAKLTETDHRVARRIVASAVSLISKFEDGEYNRWAYCPTSESYKIYFANPGIASAVDCMDEYKSLIKERIKGEPGVGLHIFGSDQVYVACRFLFGLVNEELASEFFFRLCLVPLNDLGKNDPINTLRVRLAKNDENSTTFEYSHGKQKIIREYKVQDELGWFISAWNAFYNKKKLSKIIDGIPLIAGWRRDISIKREWDIPSFNSVAGGNEIVYPEPEVTLELIKVETAEKLLEGNRFNRNPKVSVIDKYAEEMKAGLWHLNGETIKISSKGFTLDAQHRLYACIKSKTPFYSLVVRGVDHDVFTEYDTTRLKGLGDILASENRPYPKIMASALRTLCHYRRNTPDGFHTPTNHALAILADECEDIAESIDWVVSNLSNFDKLTSKPRMAFLHYILKDIDNSAAEDLLKSISTNHAIGEFGEYWNVVNLFIRGLGNQKGMSDIGKFLNFAAAVIDTWNAAMRQSKRFSLTTLNKKMFRPAGGSKGKETRAFPCPDALVKGKPVPVPPKPFHLA